MALHPDAPLLPEIAPGQLIALPIRIRLRLRDVCTAEVHSATGSAVERCNDAHWSAMISAGACPVRAHVTVTAVDPDGISVTTALVMIELRCRKATEPFVFTFLDHDGSVASAAVVLPLSSKQPTARSPPQSLPVILSLHGTGVSAQAQAEAYKVSAFM